jgi:hypothetical protein
MTPQWAKLMFSRCTLIKRPFGRFFLSLNWGTADNLWLTENLSILLLKNAIAANIKFY